MLSAAAPAATTLLLSDAEREAVEAALAHACAAGDHAVHAALPALRARVARALAAAHEPVLPLALSALERELLADAIDAFMADCNERRAEAGSRERAVRRWRAGGVALRL